VGDAWTRSVAGTSGTVSGSFTHPGEHGPPAVIRIVWSEPYSISIYIAFRAMFVPVE
jgi:hypothetical protein